MRALLAAGLLVVTLPTALGAGAHRYLPAKMPLPGRAKLREIASRGADRWGPPVTLRASWYGPGFAGRETADGERYNPWAMTCASLSLPFGTRLRVSYGGRAVVVRVNDRGPYVAGRDLDLSEAAAKALGMVEQGVAWVRVREESQELLSSGRSAIVTPTK